MVRRQAVIPVTYFESVNLDFPLLTLRDAAVSVPFVRLLLCPLCEGLFSTFASEKTISPQSLRSF